MTRPPPDIDFWEFPRLWPGECVAILAGGSSLTQEQADYLQGKCRVIAINRAWTLAPWADMLYACDHDSFWRWHPEALAFPRTKVVVRKTWMNNEAWREMKALADAGVKVICHSSRNCPCEARHEGCSPDPGVVRGDNSAFQLLSVIAHTGATTVLLLGLDMAGRHWHEGYREIGVPDYSHMIGRFETLVKPLAQAGVAVLNLSSKSAIPYWPKMRAPGRFVIHAAQGATDAA